MNCKKEDKKLSTAMLICIPHFLFSTYSEQTSARSKKISTKTKQIIHLKKGTTLTSPHSNSAHLKQKKGSPPGAQRNHHIIIAPRSSPKVKYVPFSGSPPLP